MSPYREFREIQRGAASMKRESASATVEGKKLLVASAQELEKLASGMQRRQKELEFRVGRSMAGEGILFFPKAYPFGRPEFYGVLPVRRPISIGWIALPHSAKTRGRQLKEKVGRTV